MAKPLAETNKLLSGEESFKRRQFFEVRCRYSYFRLFEL